MSEIFESLRMRVDNGMRVFLESLNFEIEMRVSQKSAFHRYLLVYCRSSGLVTAHLLKVSSFWRFSENHIFLPSSKNKFLKTFFQNALIRRQFDKNGWNQLQMATNIPDFHILKKHIKIFGHFWVIQVWSVGPLREALILSDTSISSSLSLS